MLIPTNLILNDDDDDRLRILLVCDLFSLSPGKIYQSGIEHPLCAYPRQRGRMEYNFTLGSCPGSMGLTQRRILQEDPLEVTAFMPAARKPTTPNQKGVWTRSSSGGTNPFTSFVVFTTAQ